MTEVGLHCPSCGHCLHLPSGHTVGLTRTQRKVLTAIAEMIARDGFAPTYQELAGHMGKESKSPICLHVGHLRARGFLVKAGRGRVRGLALTPEAWALFGRDEKGELRDAA